MTHQESIISVNLDDLLTVRLHIKNSLVVCTWGQKWPKFRPQYLR